MIQTNMKNKNILIAGATGGIGSGVAKHLSESGASLVLLGRNEKLLENLQKELETDSDIYVCDFSNIEKLGDVFSFCKEQGKKLDGMVYTAGVCEDLPVKAVDYSEMLRNMQINYFAYVELCKVFSNKRYSNEKSSIVALSSMASILCDKAMSQYAASKAALNAATKSMAREFARRKIRVNAIAPGFVDTRMTWNTTDIIKENLESYLEDRQPYGVIPVDEIANLIEFLLSDISGHITGETIRVAGGVY